MNLAKNILQPRQSVIALANFQRQIQIGNGLPNLDLPYYRWTGKNPGVIFYQSLVSYPWNGHFALGLLNHVAQVRGNGFFRFQNRCLQDPKPVWDIKNWIEDAESVLKFLDETESGQKRIVVACGAGAQVALDIGRKYPERIHALLLFSPWVGLTWNFIDKIVAGGTDSFRGRNRVFLATTRENLGTSITSESWANFVQISNGQTADFRRMNFPVKIFHGTADRLIPIENVYRFADRVKARPLEIVALQNQGHVYNVTPEILEILDKTICEQGERQKEEADSLRFSTLKFQSEPSDRMLRFYNY